jgi:tRNA(Ile2) C34 agmatinyltransferase TiaS
MATPDRVKNKMKELGLSGVNKPKRTPSHKTKSHVVMAKEGDQHRLIRFGQQGVKGAGKNPQTEKDKARKKSYYARHDAQGKPTTKLSAKYWSHKVKW